MRAPPESPHWCSLCFSSKWIFVFAPLPSPRLLHRHAAAVGRSTGTMWPKEPPKPPSTLPPSLYTHTHKSATTVTPPRDLHDRGCSRLRLISSQKKLQLQGGQRTTKPSFFRRPPQMGKTIFPTNCAHGRLHPSAGRRERHKSKHPEPLRRETLREFLANMMNEAPGEATHL